MDKKLQHEERERQARLLTREQAAKYLAISVRTLRRLDVPRVLILSMTRYDPADLDRWLNAQKVYPVERERATYTRHAKVEATRSPRSQEILGWLGRPAQPRTRKAATQ